MISKSRVIVCDKSLDDAADDYAWQIDPELSYLTATRPLSLTFPDYLSKYTHQLLYNPPSKYNFSIKTHNGKHIGNCVCYNINNTQGEAEIGIIIGDRHYWNKGYGTDAINVLIKHIFKNSRIILIRLKTMISNKRAQKCFCKCGFSVCGQIVSSGNSYLLMQLHYNHWQRNNKHNI